MAEATGELVAPQAHPDFLAAAAVVSALAAKADAAKSEADAIRKRYGIKKADPRRAAALLEVGRGDEAEAHEKLADLDAAAAVYADAVGRAVKDRDAVKARLERDLSDAAYKTHFLPAAKDAAAAYFALVGAFDRVREVRKELESYGLSSPKLGRAADTFGDTVSPATAKPSVHAIDSFRRLLLSWVEADILDLDEARDAFPDNVRFV